MEQEGQINNSVNNFDRIVKLSLGLLSMPILFNFIKLGIAFTLYGATVSFAFLIILFIVIVATYYLFWETYNYFNENLNNGILFFLLLFISLLPFIANLFYPIFSLENFGVYGSKFNPFYVLFGPLVMFVFFKLQIQLKNANLQILQKMYL